MTNSCVVRFAVFYSRYVADLPDVSKAVMQLRHTITDPCSLAGQASSSIVVFRHTAPKRCQKLLVPYLLRGLSLTAEITTHHQGTSPDLSCLPYA